MTMRVRPIDRRWSWCFMIAIAAAACHRAQAPAAAPPPTDVSSDNVAVVDSALVETGPELSGTLAPQRSAQLRAQVAGEVLALPVKEGAAVSSGEIVAIMDSTALAAAARSAQSQLGSAQLAADVAARNYQRSQNLHAAGAIADKDLETAHNQAVAADAAVANARSALAMADKQLANAVLRAPFAGVVSARPANVGDVLQVGNPVITIVDPSDLELDASVPAEHIAQLTPGTKVEFSVNGNPGKVFDGHIARVNPTVDSVTRQLKLYIAVPNEDRSLAAGQFAQGRVTLRVGACAGDTDRRARYPVERARRASRRQWTGHDGAGDAGYSRRSVRTCPGHVGSRARRHGADRRGGHHPRGHDGARHPRRSLRRA